MLARGTAYRCYATVEEIEAFRETGEGRGPPAAVPLALARRRPRDLARRALRHPPAGAARGRDRGRGRGAGPGDLEERDARRPGPAALGRHADLHARGRGRRPRHGRHPRDPRRRPPDQRRAPDADLPGDGLGRAGLRPYPADPRPRRRQALEAPRRARDRRLPRHGLSCPRRCATTWRGSAGATATTSSSPPSRRSRGSTSAISARRRRDSTSPSSRPCPASTSAPPTTRRLLAEVEGFLAAQKRPPLTSGERAPDAARSMPELKTRAKTIPQLLEMAHFLLGRGPFVPDAAAAKVHGGVPDGMLDRLTSRLQDASWTAGDLEAVVRDFAASEGLGLGKVAQPLRVALTGRTVSPGVFDMMRGSRPRREPGPASGVRRARRRPPPEASGGTRGRDAGAASSRDGRGGSGRPSKGDDT